MLEDRAEQPLLARRESSDLRAFRDVSHLSLHLRTWIGWIVGNGARRYGEGIANFPN